MTVRAEPAGTPDPAVEEGAGESFRNRRRSRVNEGRRRRELLSAAAPAADPQFLNAVAVADRFWGPDEQWRRAVLVGHQASDTEFDAPTKAPDPAGEAMSTGQSSVSARMPARWRVRRSREEPASAIDRLTAVDGVESPFAVPLPGRPSRMVGRGRSWVTRLALVAAPVVLIGGVAYSCGVSTGSARLIQSSTISADDAAAFHLSSYPADRAASFGVSYLTLCWTHPDAADAIGTTDRLAALARMTSAGVTPGCGWTGSTASSPPLAVTWDGTVKPVSGAYADGAAAQLGFVVTTTAGRTVGAALPIWVSSTTGNTAGLRVVGDVAVVPIPPAGAAPTVAAPPVTDPAIADAVTRSVLDPFLRAWAASDPVQLNLVLARDASIAARSGMDGQVSAPVVTRTQVVVTRGDPKAYRDGDQVTANVGVDWTTRTGGIQRTGYTIWLRMTAGRWQVTDITAAAPDPAGGKAAATTFATTPTAAPAAG